MASFTFSRRTALRAVTVASVAALGVGTSASLAAATATSNSDATIVAAISITNTAALGFGSVVADAGAAGTVQMGTDGTRTCSTVTCVAQDAGQASSFDVTGEDGYTYSITLPTSITLSDGGTESMTVDTFTDSNSGSGTLTSGADSFNVGATLNVDMAQAAGSYTGTFDVTVEYN